MRMKFQVEHNQYDAHNNANTLYAEVVNQAWDSFRDIAEQHGLKLDNATAAEEMVAHMFAYLWDSNHNEGNHSLWGCSSSS